MMGMWASVDHCIDVRRSQDRVLGMWGSVDHCHRNEEEPRLGGGCMGTCLTKPGFMEYSASVSVICKDPVYGVDPRCLGPIRF